MKITFLGTGTSQGVPVITCDCEVCVSKNEKDKRLRSSIMIEDKEKTIVVDTGPDFRQQMLRENVQQLDAILFTHEHLRTPKHESHVFWLVCLPACLY